MSYFKFIGVAERVFQVDWQMQLLKSNKQLRELDLKQIWLFHSLKKNIVGISLSLLEFE